MPPAERVPAEPRIQGWYRFQPRTVGDDAFSDAVRALILADLFTWPATWAAYPSAGPSPWIAPNLDLYVRFHASAAASEWLFCEGRADLAASGLIGAENSVWSRDGALVAAGSSQLFCRPRPERFR